MKKMYTIQMSRSIPCNAATKKLYTLEEALSRATKRASKELAMVVNGTEDDWREFIPETLAMLIDAFGVKHRLVLFPEDE